MIRFKQGDLHSLRWPYIGPRARALPPSHIFSFVNSFYSSYFTSSNLDLFLRPFASICDHCPFTILISLNIFRVWDLPKYIPPVCCTVVLLVSFLFSFFD